MSYAHSEEANPHWVRPPSLKDIEHIPGETGLPLIGNTFAVLADPIGFGNKMQANYGKIYRNRAFGQNTVMLLGPDANELVLFDRNKLFSNEQGWGPVLNLLFPRGLMLMDFDHHRMDRKALSIAFKPEPMRAYCTALSQGIYRRIADWPNDLQFYPAIKQLTLDLAATSFLGIDWGPEADKINTAFVDMVAASVGVARTPIPFTKMARGVAGRKYLIDYFTPQIAERRRNENMQDMFSQFCRATREDGEYMADDEIVDHMNFLMMAAHDTITSSITSMVWLLAKNPDWQEKLREECLSIAPAGGAIAYEDLSKFTLTEMAFKESLRLIPPVPSIPRRAVKDFEFGGYHIPAGTAVGVAPSFVHHMAEYWPEPEKFDPMRFTPEAIKERHKFAWVPFGGGAHMCLGLHFAYEQMKIFMHHLLTSRSIEVNNGYEPKWQAWPIPKPKDGLHVTLRPL
ncbi:cytochrome P450 [Sphingorhabdus lutea]|uniref:Cytochrome P450 n=1 Tax=Sphingorhabdus lutea TaxID=1913578 RepID=A0A1L3JE27_9SPHN|nr:cytochrome P450 [Sphingorhabdus lutea]APG63380.1 cytochrome P450 [Sphingorhabdus lutea]